MLSFLQPKSQYSISSRTVRIRFYYLTGWTEPGAALMIVGELRRQPPRSYKEILFLPARDLRMEKYTGVKLDAATPGVAQAAGVDAVEQMTELPAELDAAHRGRPELGNTISGRSRIPPQATALLGFTRHLRSERPLPPPRLVTSLTALLRMVKDDGEIDLIRKASNGVHARPARDDAVVGQARHHRTHHAGKMTAVWMENGCERASYAPIVGSGINSTIAALLGQLSHASKTATFVSSTLPANTPCMPPTSRAPFPSNGHFTPRQREIYKIVLGAQQAAIDAFVSGKSTINDRDRQEPNSLDTVAYNYINTHGKDLHGQPLGQYWLHGLGHMVGIDVHDPATTRQSSSREWSSPSSPAFTFPKRNSACASNAISSSAQTESSSISTPRCPILPRKSKLRCARSELENDDRSARREDIPSNSRSLTRAFSDQLLGLPG